MIVDIIENKNLYVNLSPGIGAALTYLVETDFVSLEPGRYDIDGDDVFALVQEYETIPQEQGKWECHRKYADIQFIVEGVEQIGYASVPGMEVVATYNPDKDISFLTGKGDYVTLNKGFFGIYFPGDAHQPKIAPGNIIGKVKKVVVKIKMA